MSNPILTERIESAWHKYGELFYVPDEGSCVEIILLDCSSSEFFCALRRLEVTSHMFSIEPSWRTMVHAEAISIDQLEQFWSLRVLDSFVVGIRTNELGFHFETRALVDRHHDQRLDVDFTYIPEHVFTAGVDPKANVEKLLFFIFDFAQMVHADQVLVAAENLEDPRNSSNWRIL